MTGKGRILSAAINCLLIAPAAQAAPTWDCRITPQGEWACTKDGVMVPNKPVYTALPTPPKAKPEVATEGVKTPAETVTKTVPPETTKPETVSKIVTPEAPVPAAAKTAEPSDKKEAETATRQPPAESTQPKQIATPKPVVPPKTTVKAAATPVPAAKSQEKSIRTAAKPDAQKKTGTDRIDRGLNWAQCSPGAALISGIVSPSPTTDDSVLIEADGADFLRKEDLAIFAGNVQLRQRGELLEADQLHYDKKSDEIDAQGNVFLEQSGLRIQSANLHYNLTTSQGRAEQVEYRMLGRIARGYASEAELESKELSHYKQVSYTTCPPGSSDWLLEADTLDIDKASGTGTARNATLTFKGVPFLYLPYASFPIDDRRKSGFLVPSIGTSDSTGFDISIPYYWNIAPHMDATITSRIMGKRGLMLGGEFRYLTEPFEGKVKAEILPSDEEQNADKNDTRGALSLQASGQPADRWRFDIDLNYVSDNDYLDDLGDSLAATSTKHQERRGDIRYRGSGWDFLGRLQQYQSIDETIAINDRPYSRLPQLLFDLDRPRQAMGLSHHMRAEYVRFDYSSETKIKGDRIDIQPSLSLPTRWPWGYLTPKLSVRHTRYGLTDQGVGNPSSQTRTLPMLSLDGGLFFERKSSWFGESLTQTLEPRLFYLYVPEENQNNLPVFDTSALDFSFANLFRENRFSGADRVGDANQLATALTSRTLSDTTGAELFRVSVGQIFYFKDRVVQLPGNSAVDESSSSVVGELSARLGQHWRFRAGAQVDPHDGGNIEKGSASINYRDEQQRIINLAYRYTENSIEQMDFSGRWPLSHNLHAVARWNYSELHGQTMEAFGGIEYDSCCWTTRLILREHRTDANQKTNAAIFLQLELKGLSSIGDKLDDFFEDGILGYRTEN